MGKPEYQGEKQKTKTKQTKKQKPRILYGSPQFSSISLCVMPPSPFSSGFFICHAITTILLSVLYLSCDHHHSSQCSLPVMPSTPFSSVFFIFHWRYHQRIHSAQCSLSVMPSSLFSAKFFICHTVIMIILLKVFIRHNQMHITKQNNNNNNNNNKNSYHKLCKPVTKQNLQT